MTMCLFPHLWPGVQTWPEIGSGEDRPPSQCPPRSRETRRHTPVSRSCKLPHRAPSSPSGREFQRKPLWGAGGGGLFSCASSVWRLVPIFGTGIHLRVPQKHSACTSSPLRPPLAPAAKLAFQPPSLTAFQWPNCLSADSAQSKGSAAIH